MQLRCPAMEFLKENGLSIELNGGVLFSPNASSRSGARSPEQASILKPHLVKQKTWSR